MLCSDSGGDLFHVLSAAFSIEGVFGSGHKQQWPAQSPLFQQILKPTNTNCVVDMICLRKCTLPCQAENTNTNCIVDMICNALYLAKLNTEGWRSRCCATMLISSSTYKGEKIVLIIKIVIIIQVIVIKEADLPNDHITCASRVSRL